MEVVWLLRAEVALQAAFERESEWSEVRALELLESIDQTLEVVKTFPEFYRIVFAPFRRAIVGPQNRFGLFYVVEDRGIVVHALEDLRQDPERIRRSLGNR